MKRRIRQALCALVGHQRPQAVAGRYQGMFLRASICPRCQFIYESEIGKRQLRRANRRRA